MKTRRSLRVAAVAVLAVVGLSACASTPSAKRVAQDVVATLDVPDSVKQCMNDAIDTFTTEQLETIAEAADSGDATALQPFEAQLRRCRSGG